MRNDRNNARLALMLSAAVSLAVLAGCSGGEEPAPPPPDNGGDMELIDQPPPVEATPTPEPTPSPPPARSPDAEFTDEEQVMEDAEATGMTSRIDRTAPPPGESEAPPPEQPAQEAEAPQR